MYLTVYSRPFSIMSIISFNSSVEIFCSLANEGDHFLVRVLEIVVHHTSHKRPFIFFLWDQRPVFVSISVTFRFHVLLTFQILHNRSECRIRRLRLFILRQDVFDKITARSARSSASHPLPVLLIFPFSILFLRSYRKSTNLS